MVFIFSTKLASLTPLSAQSQNWAKSSINLGLWVRVSRWLKLHHVFLVYLWLSFLSTLEQQGDCFRVGQWSERSLIANALLDSFEAPHDTLLSISALMLAARFVMQIRHYIVPQLDYTRDRHCETTVLIWEGRKKETILTRKSPIVVLFKISAIVWSSAKSLNRLFFGFSALLGQPGEVICTTLKLSKSAKSAGAAGSPAVRDAEKKKMKDSVHF